MPNTCDGPVKSKSEDGDNINTFTQQNQNKNNDKPVTSPVKFLTDESKLCKKM